MSFIDYLRDTRAELKHVSWPTARQAFIYSALVVVISIVVAFYTGILDYAFTTALNWFIE